MSKELEIFLSFAKHHPIRMEVVSARKAREPKPDIECDKADGSGALDLPPFIGPMASRVLGSLWCVKTARVWRTLPV